MKNSQYSSADEWREAAMQRISTITDTESQQRAELAETHNRREGITDADTLADQQLYIQGKMELDEYQDYLLFKHSKP